MVSFGHRNKGTRAGGNGGISGETGSSTRAQKGRTKGAKGKDKGGGDESSVI